MSVRRIDKPSAASKVFRSFVKTLCPTENCMKFRRAVPFIFAWYFLLSLDGGSATQVGPFATQQACQSYQTEISGITFKFMTPCFSTTTK